MKGSTIIPSLRYHDAVTAVDWLCEAFGFEKHLVVPDEQGGIAHAQLSFGTGMIMLGSDRGDEYGHLQAPLANREAPVSQSAYIVVDDVDAHCARARELGAEIVMQPADQPYGGRLYACRDSTAAAGLMHRVRKL